MLPGVRPGISDHHETFVGPRWPRNLCPSIAPFPLKFKMSEEASSDPDTILWKLATSVSISSPVTLLATRSRHFSDPPPAESDFPRRLSPPARPPRPLPHSAGDLVVNWGPGAGPWFCTKFTLPTPTVTTAGGARSSMGQYVQILAAHLSLLWASRFSVRFLCNLEPASLSSGPCLVTRLPHGRCTSASTS